MTTTQLGQGAILIGISAVVLVAIAVMLFRRRVRTVGGETGCPDEMPEAADMAGSAPVRAAPAAPSHADETVSGTLSGIVLRETLSDNEALPRKPYAESPDILPMGLQPLGNPATLTGADSYAVDVGGPVYVGQPNYLYLRGRNTTVGEASGTWNLFWAPRNLLLYPDLWQSNQLATASGDSDPTFTIAAGTVGVSNDPFLWLAPMTPGMDPCSLIAIAATPELGNPLVGVTGISGLAQALANNVNIAQRSLRCFPSNAPNMSDTAYYAHGSEPATVMFVMEFENMPGGSSFTLATDTPFDGGGPTLTGPIPTATSNYSWGPFVIPAGWTSTFSYTVNLGSDRSTIPAGQQSKVTLCAYFLEDTDDGPDDRGGAGPVRALLAGSVSAALLAEF